MMSASNAPSISLNSRISLHPLSEQVENDVVIVGRGDQFLELPLAGLDFVGWLKEGLSLGQARERFEARYNPFPDEELLEVINAFYESDFVAAVDDHPIVSRRPPHNTSSASIPQKWAQALFSKPVLMAWITIAVPAAIIWIVTPQLWPVRSDFFWSDHYFIVVLVGLLLWLSNMGLHEGAHWLACRAKGIRATITWTQRLGFLPMSQTIMHDIWAVPRPARYLPISAGMVWDIFGISLVLYLLFFDVTGFWTLPLLVTKLLKFYLLTSAMALTAQFWLFSKMDGYFLLSALLGQRNLQGDTYDWLKAKAGRNKTFDPPASGMKFIYVYALITLLWGGLFVGQFLLINLPIKLQLLWESWLKVLAGPELSALDFADGLAVFVSQMIFWGLLLYAYWRDTIPNWRQT